MASYRQVIEAFPDGGGSYAVAKRHLGRRTSLVTAASLILDYVLNVAVSVTAGVAALTSAFPALYGGRVWLCLAVLALVTLVNRRGIVDSARAFIVPTAVFVAAILSIIVVGLFRAAPVSVVPVASLSRLTSEALTAAVSLGDEVRAVTVTHPDDDERIGALRRDWAADAVICRLRFRLKTL